MTDLQVATMLANPSRAPRGKGTHVYVDRFREYLSAAGITRPVRWHDLRHTCASALLQGQWGDKWTIEEVSAQLGHSSISVTERYAHLGETVLKKAAKKVRNVDSYAIAKAPPLPRVGGALVRGPDEQDPCVAAIRNDSAVVDPRGIEPLTSALRTRRSPS